MANSMQHWNNNQMVVCSIKTTGDDLDWNEMAQVSFIALDSNSNVRRDILPLNLNIRCEYPERNDPKHLRKKMFLETQKNMPMLPTAAEEALIEWIDRLGIRSNKYNNRKKAMILCYDAPFLLPWLQRWLTLEFDDQFDVAKTRDIRVASMYLNDYQGMHCEKVRFVKQSLSYLTSTCELPRIKKKDTLNECLLIARIYNYMLRRGNN